MAAPNPTAKPEIVRKGFRSEEDKKKFLANPTRFPTDDELLPLRPPHASRPRRA
jgi:hypothetical protein